MEKPNYPLTRIFFMTNPLRTILPNSSRSSPFSDFSMSKPSIPPPQHQREIEHPEESHRNDKTSYDFDDSNGSADYFVAECSDVVADHGPSVGVPDYHDEGQDYQH